MSDRQGRVCAICSRPEKQLRRGVLKRLAVDHCHTTGKIRGLLCAACNVTLGKFGDDPVLLDVAAAYLRHHSTEDAPCR